MASRPSRALVPVAGNAVPTTGQGARQSVPFDLVSVETALRDRAQVERFLPDILGRVLARCWIDSAFRTAFATDPKATLAAHRIHLPDSICIEVVTEGQTRPMVIVSEMTGASGPVGSLGGSQNGTKRRLLYLQLVMVAGK